MAYVMLYGSGWTQRWQVAEGRVEQVRAEIERVGRAESGSLSIIDPESGSPARLMVAWQHVVTAVVIDDGATADHGDDSGRAGQYR